MLPSDLATADTPRILIVRVSALGDMVFATSLLDGLRARWPRAHIAWLAQSGFAGILEGDPRLDEIIPVAKDALRSAGGLARLRRELRARRFDLVLDAQGLLKSRLLARLAGGHRIGFDSKEPGRILMHHLLPKGGEVQDISSEYRYFAEQLTGRPATAPRLPVSEAAAAGAHERLAALGLTPGFVALCPFTTRPQKHWFEHYWPELAARLAAAGRGPAVIFGGPADREAAARIAAASTVPVVNLAGQTRLPELPALLAQAGVVVGVDTGLTHIGIAVRRPVVALFGSTCPYTRGAESPLTVLYDALPCAPCKRRPTCGGAWTCMRQLTPDRAATAALALLERA
ncbi:MAG TPA: glycosyltransferase family 9 protein [Solimonas sp.]|nr:glycosyltransferase family 9 protein [Solimonas sp.]